MSLDISELMSKSGCWEIAGYIATGIVLIGVAGEVITDLTLWIKSKGLRRQIEIASALILLVGLAGEILTQVQANNTTSLIIALLNDETARLNAENLVTEKNIQPREFPIYGHNSDAAQLNAELEKYLGTKVWVQTVPDFESERLTVSLMGLFRAVHWNASAVGPSETGIGMLAIEDGVRIVVKYPYDKFPPPAGAPPNKLLNAADLFWKRLKMELGDNFFSVHIEYLSLPMPDGKRAPSPEAEKLPDDTMLILVGMKPVPALISEKNAKIRALEKQ